MFRTKIARLVAIVLSGILTSSCYMDVLRRSDAPIRRPLKTGLTEGPAGVEVRFDLDRATLRVQSLAEERVAQFRREELVYSQQTCKQENREKYRNGYAVSVIYGVAAAGFGGLCVSSIVPHPTAGKVLIGLSVVPLIATIIADSRHDDEEIFDCQATDETERDVRRVESSESRRRISDYEIVARLPDNDRQLASASAQDGRAVLELAGMPLSSGWILTGARGFDTLPGIATFIEEKEIAVRAMRGNQVLGSTQVKMPAYALDRYLRAQAQRLVPADNRQPRLVFTKFVVEDINSRMPIAEAMVNLTMKHAPTFAAPDLPYAAMHFAEMLRDVSPDAADRFRAFTQEAFQERVAEARPGQPQTVEAGLPVEVTTNSRGAFDVNLYAGADVKIELRHPRYYFQTLRLQVRSGSQGLTFDKGKNVVYEDPDVPNQYRIGLQDIGERVRRAGE
jgi:hypothetical protein